MTKRIIQIVLAVVIVCLIYVIYKQISTPIIFAKEKAAREARLQISEAKEFIEKGYIGGGMLPKLNNCIDAIENGVSRVHILDGRIPHCLLLEIFTNKGIGTAILKDGDEMYSNK